MGTDNLRRREADDVEKADPLAGTPYEGFVPRGTLVLLRIVNIGKIRSIITPDQAVEGKRYMVVLAGPLVRDLEPGDEVQIVGRCGIEWDFLPGSRELFVLLQSNIPIVKPVHAATYTDRARAGIDPALWGGAKQAPDPVPPQKKEPTH